MNIRPLLYAVLACFALTSAARNLATPPASAGLSKATFAGGCFWCMEKPFLDLPGVTDVVSGYTDGDVTEPSYEAVSAGTTGHTEAVEVVFDPARVSYAQLLRVFWQNIDPVAQNRQFCDRGTQYRSGIYTHDDAQQRAALASLDVLKNSALFAGQTIHTEIKAATVFYRAEDYHQRYFEKNPTRYKYYRWNCGRDQRLTEIWGTPSPVSPLLTEQ